MVFVPECIPLELYHVSGSRSATKKYHRSRSQHRDWLGEGSGVGEHRQGLRLQEKLARIVLAFNN